MGKGEAEGEGEGEGTRREDRPIFINLTGSLARLGSLPFFPLEQRPKREKQQPKKRNHKTKQVQSTYQALRRQSRREKFLGEGM